MGYKVKVQAEKPKRGPRLTRVYGTGREGKGEAYITRLGAEKRAKALRREFPAKGGFEINIVRTQDYY